MRTARRPVLHRMVPVARELPAYRGGTLRRDLLAGVTVAALALPAAMAYAELAGLYALLFPTVAYTLLGSSRQLIVGPEGSIAALVATAVAQLVELAREASGLSATTLAVGALCLAALLLLRRWVPRIPGPLVVVVLAIAASATLGLAASGVAVVGQIPSGLPGLQVPAWRLGDVLGLLPVVLVFLTAPMQYLPKATLGAVIVAAAIGLVDPAAWRGLARTSRVEVAIAAVTLAGSSPSASWRPCWWRWRCRSWTWHVAAPPP
jgi:SulP family sulfate permease